MNIAIKQTNSPIFWNSLELDSPYSIMALHAVLEVKLLRLHNF